MTTRGKPKQMTIEIIVMNESTVVSNDEINAMIPALKLQWNCDLAPIWGLSPADFTFQASGTPKAGTWWIVFFDDSDQASALAYHDLTNEGLPIAKIFAKTIQQEGSSLSVGTSHEVCEMAVDPWLNMSFQDPNGTFWAGEVCDPVEDDQYAYKIYNTLVSDFVKPAWFGPKNVTGAIDFKNHCTSPFQVLTAGYAQQFDPNQGWLQITGQNARMSKQKAPATGTRRERRLRGSANWQKSNPVFKP